VRRIKIVVVIELYHLDFESALKRIINTRGTKGFTKDTKEVSSKHTRLVLAKK